MEPTFDSHDQPESSLIDMRWMEEMESIRLTNLETGV